jgi:hypothetical protein
MYLKPETKAHFEEVGGYESYIKLFKKTSLTRNVEDDFLLARIGFVISAEKGEVVQKLVSDGILEDIQKVRILLNKKGCIDGLGIGDIR